MIFGGPTGVPVVASFKLIGLPKAGTNGGDFAKPAWTKDKNAGSIV